MSTVVCPKDGITTNFRAVSVQERKPGSLRFGKCGHALFALRDGKWEAIGREGGV